VSKANLIRYSRVPQLAAMLAVGLAVLPSLGCDGCGGDQYAQRDAGTDAPFEGGAVFIEAGFDNCPSAAIEVSPSTAKIGEAVSLTGSATDADRDPLTFSWKASGGTLGSTSAQETTFTCTDSGPATLTLSVSDGVCTTMQSVSVFCLAMQDGGAAGNTGSAGGTGAGGSTGTGGSGSGGTSGGVNTCPGAEPTHGSSACPACTVANCSLGPTGTDGCCGLASPADQVLCEAAVACFAGNNCTLSGDPVGCFCGTSATSCYTVKGAANGPCVAPVVAAANSSDPTVIKGKFTASTNPLGRAVNLLNCWGSSCMTECQTP